jgi:hypothetical protein
LVTGARHLLLEHGLLDFFVSLISLDFEASARFEIFVVKLKLGVLVFLYLAKIIIKPIPIFLLIIDIFLVQLHVLIGVHFVVVRQIIKINFVLNLFSRIWVELKPLGARVPILFCFMRAIFQDRSPVYVMLKFLVGRENFFG